MTGHSTILFAGGGSGGHISPGLAIAERLAEIAPGSRSIFICSQRAIDETMLRDANARFVAVPATPPSKRPVAAARFLINFRRSKRAVMNVIAETGATRLVTLGGFVAAPAVSAARACGVPVTVVNLDDPPGKANLWMARRANRVVSSIELKTMPGFASQIVGMPVRRRTLAPADPSTCRTKLGLEPDRLTLLVTGASQGATSINAFVPAFAAANAELLKGWQILHLAGHGADEAVRREYAAAGVDPASAKVLPFLNEMGLAWGAADLAISRAGASSVAEAAHNAVPTLFLPYPYHVDMHQKHNAQPLVDLGGAVIAIDQIDPAANVSSVGPMLHVLMTDSAGRHEMRQRLREHCFPDAAATIARMLV